MRAPVFAMFEVVATFVHSFTEPASTSLLLYSPGSCNVTQSFFDNFSDLLQRLNTFSAPMMIADDFNIHVNDTLDAHAGKLTS